MSKSKPVYSPLYRQQLVELVLTGRSANDVDLYLSDVTLRRMSGKRILSTD